MKPRTLAAALALATLLPIAASAAVSVSIDIAPPALPVYVQPPIPAAGYLWTPGYWRWSAATGDYFWVPGTWVAPPYVGALWTPGWWGWGSGGYAWHGGYWGTRVGFYGGINYGFGYVGHGYQGGYWNGGAFNYNRSVNNVNTTIVRNVYNTTVVNNNNVTRTSFNGGQGGIAARPTREEQQVRAEQHTPPTSVQRQHEQVAMRTPEQRASVNHGAPAFAASPRAGEMHAPGGEGRGRGEALAGRGGDAVHDRAEPMPREHGAAMHAERGHPGERMERAERPPEHHAERGQPGRGEHREGGREH